ncbi:hypothetical protein BDD30_1358 [Photorhabdus asymbiotica]|uniref:Uncharacterized protein n=1 Tax=Photorhabdus asymbiotica TaxID=291112 RepID=A0ABX9SMP5_9GAMM|nr:hypothetical protein BDD30_1358 [Photorhabdus asymbiotica]
MEYSIFFGELSLEDFNKYCLELWACEWYWSIIYNDYFDRKFKVLLKMTNRLKVCLEK